MTRIPLPAIINEKAVSALQAQFRANPGATLNVDNAGIDAAANHQHIWGAMGKGGRKYIDVTGSAKNEAFYFCCLADRVKCTDSSVFTINGVNLYDSAGNYLNDPDKAAASNSLLNMLQVRTGSNEPAFKEITGCGYADVFEHGKDVTLTAIQAQRLGIVDEIYSGDDSAPIVAKTAAQSPHNETATQQLARLDSATLAGLTFDTFRSLYPKVYNLLVDEGRQQARASAIHTLNTKAIEDANLATFKAEVRQDLKRYMHLW